MDSVILNDMLPGDGLINIRKNDLLIFILEFCTDTSRVLVSMGNMHHFVLQIYLKSSLITGPLVIFIRGKSLPQRRRLSIREIHRGGTEKKKVKRAVILCPSQKAGLNSNFM